MLLVTAAALFIVWLLGLLLTKGSFIHLVLLNSIALAAIHFAARHRCGQSLFKI
jgi:hypothetical protein